MKSNAMLPVLAADPEGSVFDRYTQAANAVEPALCCPVNYNADYLEAIPQEVIDKDYGCGDPTRFVRPGETVLDLGSGAGKACYIMAQVVGAEGRVIGVDANAPMLALARKHRETVAERLGYGNVEFRCGLIQDLALDLELLDAELTRSPIGDRQRWLELRSLEERLRAERPLIADESIDCAVSNCVLNLVRPQDRVALFAEIFRVLKRGGRCAISDIVADEDVPDELQRDGKLWSGCLSGAFREDRFLEAFEQAGFHGIQIADRQVEPWQTVAGIEFRSLTVLAFKGQQGPSLERNQAVVYRGPFKRVADDDGHVFPRGERIAVGDETYRLLQRDPYDGLFDPIEPRIEIPPAEAQPFEPCRTPHRDPRESKGHGYNATTVPGESCCGP